MRFIRWHFPPLMRGREQDVSPAGPLMLTQRAHWTPEHDWRRANCHRHTSPNSARYATMPIRSTIHEYRLKNTGNATDDIPFFCPTSGNVTLTRLSSKTLVIVSEIVIPSQLLALMIGLSSAYCICC